MNNGNINIDELLTADEVKKMFGITHMTLYNWRRSQAFPIVKIRGGKTDAVRYELAAVIQWAGDHGKEIVWYPETAGK